MTTEDCVALSLRPIATVHFNAEGISNPAVFHRRRLAAADARRSRPSLLDLHHQRPSATSSTPSTTPSAAPPQLAHARRVDLQQGLLPESVGVRTLPILGALVPRPVDGQPAIKPALVS
jgi:hypothetical protein